MPRTDVNWTHEMYIFWLGNHDIEESTNSDEIVNANKNKTKY